MITQERLKELLSYNSETGQFHWLVDKLPIRRIGDLAGQTNKKGYVRITIGGKAYQAHRLAWLYIHGHFPEKFIDHIDRNPSNNRISNLRPATNAENHININRYKSNKSGVKGVFPHKGKYRAKLAGTHIGTFPTIELAKQAYQSLAKERYGEFACDA